MNSDSSVRPYPRVWVIVPSVIVSTVLLIGVTVVAADTSDTHRCPQDLADTVLKMEEMLGAA